MADPFASPQQVAEKLRYLLSDKERELADLRARTKVLRSQARRMEGNVQAGRQQLQQVMEDAEKASKELSDLQIHEVLAGASRARLTASKTHQREKAAYRLSGGRLTQPLHSPWCVVSQKRTRRSRTSSSPTSCGRSSCAP